MDITESEQLSFRNKAKKELERLQSIYDDTEIKQEIDAFKNRFLICEVVYKVILEEHQYRKTGKRSDRLKVDMTQAPHALAFVGYDFDRGLLTLLFGAENHVGRRSVKKLRDALTHKVSESAVDELLTRKEELYICMNSFLEKIERFDAIE